LVLGSTQTQCVTAVMVSSAPGGYRYPSWDSQPPVGLLPSPSKACCLTSCLQKGSFISLQASLFCMQVWLDDLSCMYLAHRELKSVLIINITNCFYYCCYYYCYFLLLLLFLIIWPDESLLCQESRRAAKLRASRPSVEQNLLSFALIKQEKKACSVINSVRHQLCMECRLNEPMQESIFQSSSVQELHTKMKQGCSRVQWWHLSGDEGFSRILGLYRCKAPSKRKSSAKMSGVSS